MILPNPLTILLKILFALFAQNIGQLHDDFISLL